MNFQKHIKLISAKGLAIFLLSLLFYQCAPNDKKTLSKEAYTGLINNFKSPPDSVKPWCYWYWINDDISKEGVTKDLEAMKQVGIGAALIGNINPLEKDGRVPLFSDEWWETMVHAVNEGKRLGIDIGVFNSPGWSQSGGPWVKADMAMRYTVYSETELEGPGETAIQLERPTDEFQDTYVLAFPSGDPTFTTNETNTTITTVPQLSRTENWLSEDSADSPLFSIEEHDEYQINLETEEPIAARNLTLTPSDVPFQCECELEAMSDGQYKSIKQFSFDRQKMTPEVGPYLQGPLSISFPKVESDKFRLICSDFKGFVGQVEQTVPKEVGFSKISLSSALVLDHYIEKQLAKMHPTPFPTWQSYAWEQQDAPDVEGLEIETENIIDISDKMDENGILTWKVPKGEWTVQRFGMTPTGTKNAPAAPQGKGYEIDKMSEELVRFHFDQFVGKFLEKIPEESKSAFKYVIADSYEMGSQNWTDGFRKEFEEIYGYDPTPFLPTYTGKVVESIEASERFLWDLRRLVADEVAYEYVGGLEKISNEHNLKLWLENYGHWGFPSEFLMYGGQSDLVSGEFWNEGSLGNIECKAASSAAHIYGKPVTSAEAFTAAGNAYLRHPALLRKRGDWSFTEGINHFVLHLYIHQPDDNRKPGVNAWFSTEFNRHNTWFDQSKAWMDYLRRSQVLLQQGRYVADVCYFIGENTPVMTGERNPELPKGYSYDYINAEAILERLSVADGKLMLPDGMSYRMMVLPPSKTMRPEVLAKIEELVAAGGTIYGAAPEKSPSYENFPQADDKVQSLANKLWGSEDHNGILKKQHGKGYVLNGMELQEALDFMQLPKDVDLNGDAEVLWTHRARPGMDIYFLTNQSDGALDINPTFRTQEGEPQLWDAVTAEIRTLPEFEIKEDKTTLSIHFEKDQSWFVIFTDQAAGLPDAMVENFPQPKVYKPLGQSWTVDFKNKDIGPKETVAFPELTDWTKAATDSIRYYSGTATYKSTFTIEKLPQDGRLFINLGEVNVMAKVKINGNEIGTAWMAPYRLPIHSALKKGENSIEIEVVNLWRNRMLRDKSLPEDERYTWNSVDDIEKDEEPQPSGLLGPVNLEIIN